jgi:hypothetical protein
MVNDMGKYGRGRKSISCHGWNPWDEMDLNKKASFRLEERGLFVYSPNFILYRKFL